MRRPIVTSKVAVLSTGREDEVVERDVAVRQDNLSHKIVHANHFAEANHDILLATHYTSNGDRDIAG